MDEPTIRILGPLDVRRDGARVDLGQRRQRLMLGLLALWAGQPVGLARLTEIAWFGQEPPPSARNGIQVGMSRLRAALGDAASITTVGDAYRLDVQPERVDVHLFRSRVTLARRQDADTRIAALREADRLWLGPVLAAELTDEARQWFCAGLEEERIAAIVERIAAELELGHHRVLIGELTDLVRVMPTRERLVAQLMLALYRDGQTARALDVAAAAKRVLADELGIDAGPEIRDLELAILRQASELDLPTGRHVGGRADAGDVDARHVDARHVDAGERADGPGQSPGDLPGDAAWFTGRRAELDALDVMLGADTGTGPRVAIVTGPGGVGKSALALRWAHRSADRFPDGCLFADLRGSIDGAAVRSADTLGRFLAALGLPADRVSMDPEAAARTYRDALANRRTLIVLDNAADGAQVRPLLPGVGGCAVLVTSRDRIDELVARDGARHLGLSALSATEATALLGRAIGDERVTAEPAAAAELARLCAYLPLALRLAAAALARAPGRTVADYVASLAGGTHPATPALGKPHSPVRSTFELSYAELDAASRGVFRLIGIAPGSEITVAAVAALTDTDACSAEQAMRRLTAAHLLAELTPGRFGLHDLLRGYASERAECEDSAHERTAAVERLLRWYVGAARAAAELVYPHMVRLDGRGLPETPVDAGVPFSADAGAVAWFDAEHTNLLAVADFAAATGRDRVAWLIADALRGFFWHTRLAGEWLRLAHTGLDAAVRAGDERAEVAMRLNLAGVHHCLARRTSAITEYVAARTLAQRIGWVDAEEAILTNLGIAYADVGDLTAATETYRVALSLSRHRSRRTVALVNLGGVLHQMGRLADSVRHHEAALDLARRAKFVAGEATALQYLGYSEHAVGALDDAREHLTLALWVHRRTGNRHQEAQALMDLAAVHLDAGRPADAYTTIEAALDMVRERSEQHTESLVLAMRGRIRAAVGRVDEAISDLAVALELARRARALYAQTCAEIELADAHRASGQHSEAIVHAESALATSERTGYRALVGEALTVRSAIRTDLGDDRGVADAERAVALQRETGYRMAEARALRALAAAIRGTDLAAASRHERAAYDIVDQITPRRAPLRHRRISAAIARARTA